MSNLGYTKIGKYDIQSDQLNAFFQQKNQYETTMYMASLNKVNKDEGELRKKKLSGDSIGIVTMRNELPNYADTNKYNYLLTDEVNKWKSLMTKTQLSTETTRLSNLCATKLTKPKMSPGEIISSKNASEVAAFPVFGICNVAENSQEASIMINKLASNHHPWFVDSFNFSILNGNESNDVATLVGYSSVGAVGDEEQIRMNAQVERFYGTLMQGGSDNYNFTVRMRNNYADSKIATGCVVLAATRDSFGKLHTLVLGRNPYKAIQNDTQCTYNLDPNNPYQFCVVMDPRDYVPPQDPSSFAPPPNKVVAAKYIKGDTSGSWTAVQKNTRSAKSSTSYSGTWYDHTNGYGTQRYTKTKGSSFSVTFNGTSAVLYTTAYKTAASDTYATANVYLDNVLKLSNVSCLVGTQGGDTILKALYTVNNLTNGRHTIRVETTSAGIFTYDYIEFTGPKYTNVWVNRNGDTIKCYASPFGDEFGGVDWDNPITIDLNDPKHPELAIFRGKCPIGIGTTRGNGMCFSAFSLQDKVSLSNGFYSMADGNFRIWYDKAWHILNDASLLARFGYSKFIYSPFNKKLFLLDEGGALHRCNI